MTITCTLLLFSFRMLLRLDILAWFLGVPLLLIGIGFLIYQYRSFRSLRKELDMLDKVKTHSVEYDLVMKAMKLLVWRIDIPTHTVNFETDYRDHIDNIDFASGIKTESVLKMMTTESAEAVRKGFEGLLAGRIDVFHAQYQIKFPNSERTYWGEGFATIDKRDLQGNPLSIVGTTMRIDQQKEIEQALMDAVYHAEESDRLKSAFLANISHEIRTPLNAIVGFSDVLTQVKDPNEQQQLIKLIKQNNDHLLRLFGDIVNMSKLEARGGGAIKESTFKLGDVFKDLIDQYKMQSQEIGVSLEIEDEKSLPELTTDRERVHEIINQYLNNAMKFTPAGKVTLGCSEREDVIRIYVKDTGIGIPKEKCNERLFERFVKVDDFVAGTGLGLSICRSLAMTLNGKVGVESKEGVGSVFWLELGQKKNA